MCGSPGKRTATLQAQNGTLVAHGRAQGRRLSYTMQQLRAAQVESLGKTYSALLSLEGVLGLARNRGGETALFPRCISYGAVERRGGGRADLGETHGASALADWRTGCTWTAAGETALPSRWNSYERVPEQGLPVLVLFLGLGAHSQVLPPGGSTSALGSLVVPTSP